MKERVLDVLLFPFEQYVEDELVQGQDQEALKNALLQTGFASGLIDKAFGWLAGLSDRDAGGQSGCRNFAPRSHRVFTGEEQARLDPDSRGLLLLLEQADVLEPGLRELVIDRVMALDTDDMDLDQLKWVAQTVRFNHPGEGELGTRANELVFEEATGPLH